jgi:hypothetical protein
VDISRLLSIAGRANTDYKRVKHQLKEEKSKRDKSQRNLKDTQEAQIIIQQVTQSIQKHIHSQIASVVTRCLKSVFGEKSYDFEISFERKRGKTEARMILKKGEMELDPLDSVGGGVLDVTAFALRLACLMLQKPTPRKTIFLDEPFHHINGPIYQERIAQLVQLLSEELDFQFVIVSDDEWMKIGKVTNL